MKCLECGVEFKAARKSAQFHNATCRKNYNRKKNPIEKIVKAPIVKTVQDLEKLELKTKKNRFPQALRMTNPDFASRMTFGGSVSHKTKRIYYKLPNGEQDSMKYTD